MYEWVLAIVVGFLGGVFDSLLVNKGFVMPGMRTGTEDRKVYDPGFIGNLLVGGAAGFTAWALGADAQFSDKSIDVGPVIAAFLAGTGGSEVLAGFVKRQYLEGTNEQTTSALTDALTREQQLREQLIQQSEEIQRLKGSEEEHR